MQIMYTKLYPNWTQYLASNSNNSIVHFGKIQLLLYLTNLTLAEQHHMAIFYSIFHPNQLQKNMEITLRNSTIPSSKVRLLLHWFSCNLTTTERNSYGISFNHVNLTNWLITDTRSQTDRHKDRCGLHLRWCFYFKRNKKTGLSSTYIAFQELWHVKHRLVMNSSLLNHIQ